jgi:hypothetical protein
MISAGHPWAGSIPRRAMRKHPPGIGVAFIEQPRYRCRCGTPPADWTAGYRRRVRLTSLRDSGGRFGLDRRLRDGQRNAAAGRHRAVAVTCNPPTLVTGSDKIYVRDTRHARPGRLMFFSSRTKEQQRRRRVPPDRGEGAGPTPTRLRYHAVERKFGSIPGFPGGIRWRGRRQVTGLRRR